GGWTEITGATASTFSAPTTTPGTFFYRVRVVDPNNGCAGPASSAITVIVSPDATVSVDPGNAEVCIGGLLTLTATVTGGSPALTRQWQTGLNAGGPWANLTGENGLTYTVPTNTIGTFHYRLQLTDPNSDCDAPFSNV